MTVRRGFTIIELLVVIAALAIVAALAIPGDVGHGRSNDSRAIEALMDIRRAQATFRERRLAGGRHGDLRELAEAGLVDPRLGEGTMNGYVFEGGPGPRAPEVLWFATARPVAPRTTGERYFAVSQAGVIHYTCAAPIAVPRDTCAVPSSALPVGK